MFLAFPHGSFLHCRCLAWFSQDAFARRDIKRVTIMCTSLQLQRLGPSQMEQRRCQCQEWTRTVTCIRIDLNYFSLIKVPMGWFVQPSTAPIGRPTTWTCSSMDTIEDTCGLCSLTAPQEWAGTLCSAAPYPCLHGLHKLRCPVHR